MIFLEMNGWRLSSSLSQDDIVEFGIAVAESKLDLEAAATWFENHSFQ